MSKTKNIIPAYKHLFSSQSLNRAYEYVDFVENVLHNEELPMDFSEVTINETSSFVGKRFAESQIKERFHSIVIALRRGEELMSNPHAQERIQVGDVLLVLGPTEYLGELQHFAQSSEK